MQLGAYFTLYGEDVDTVDSALKKRDDIKKSAFEVVKKIPNYRLPVEQNLLVSILYKAFVKVDPRVAKRFAVLATLANKLKTI